MVFDKSFYEDGWDKWEDMKKFGPMSRHTRRLIKKMLSGISFNSILDVGCGEGSLLKDIISHQDKCVRVAGADISETALAIARGQVKEGEFST